MYISLEEYVPIADTLINSLKKNITEFQNHDTTYTDDYIDNFQSKTNEVRQKESTDVLLVNQKSITQTLYNISDDLKTRLSVMTIIFKKANVLSDLPKQTTQNINKRNIEGTIENIKDLTAVITSNNNILTENGLKDDTLNVLNSALSQITKLSSEQTELQKKRKQFTNENQKLYKQLKKYISEVCKMGKIVFRNQQTADEYTIDKLVATVHHSASKSTKSKIEKSNS